MEYKLRRLVPSNLDQSSLGAARAQFRKVPAQATNQVRPTAVDDWTSWDNHFLGGRNCEEDSPGNYVLRETGGRVEYLTYDAEGAEHLLYDWPLRQ